MYLGCMAVFPRVGHLPDVPERREFNYMRQPRYRIGQALSE